METLYKKLSSRGFTPNQALSSRQRISLKELKVVYALELRPSMECCSFHVDGDIIADKTTTKCDYVVLVKSALGLWGETFIELKRGQDMSHAILQLKSTLEHPLFSQTEHCIRRARVVTANRIPANTGKSVIERAKIDFKKLGCDFRPIKSLQPDLISEENF